MNEQELLADCLRRLNRSSVTYYLTGSMASNFWGIPRTTHDLDFVVQLPMSAVPRIVEAFSGEFIIDEAAVRAAARRPYRLGCGRRMANPRDGRRQFCAALAAAMPRSAGNGDNPCLRAGKHQIKSSPCQGD